MGREDNQHNILELLIVHEEKISELYHIYAENFSELASFWNKISAEEIGHAGWLKNLKARIERGEVLLKRDRFPTGAIRVSLEHIGQLIEEAIGKGRPLSGALNAALDIEEGLIEMEYYKVLDGDSEEVAATFNRLAVEEKQHRMAIKEKLISLTGKKG